MNQSGIVRYIDGMDSLKLAVDGLYERFETGLVRRFLKPGGVFVDVGAHIGYYSSLAAGIVGPGGRVFSFEPEPENFRLLGMNVERFGPAVRTYQAAVSNKPGRAVLWISKVNSGDHQLYQSQDRAGVEVEVVTLDSHPDLAGLQVDFLKVDVQGLEVQVLLGAADLISRSPNMVGIVELWPQGLKAVSLKPADLLEVLSKLGLKAYLKGGKRRLHPASYPAVKSISSHLNLIVSRGRLL